MDRIDAMKLFGRIVERGSFSLAARDLSVSPSAATDAIKQLESRLGVRLLQRTTRHVRPTLDGEAFYQRCLAILADLEDAEGAFSQVQPRGLLRVEVQGSMARRFILPGLARFFADHPHLQLFMSEGDRFVDPVREGMDCVLRVGEPQDSNMIGRRVALLEEMTVASPEYLAQFGRPAHWDALDGHRMVGFHSSATGGVLPLEFMDAGVRRTVILPMTLTVNGADTYHEAARRGLGLIQVPSYGVRAELAQGSLVEVLAETPPSPSPVSILYPRNRQLNLRVRVFIDWIAKELAAHVAQHAQPTLSVP
jgi:DNA-binding transcriptional LysR family regulator